MKKQLNFKVWLVLLAISILAALVVKLDIGLNVAAAIILALFMLKFLFVAFYFMELKKANVFWKWAVTIFASLFLAIVLIIF
ncbi:cytochrome C oxidase subunit IV family protein [Lutibacter sp.]|uniref:cytochrome C oxidase subunit IV family protein n=1 Tax=Lutibacter sp. TaxID=1925666 RepID=UPI00356404BE